MSDSANSVIALIPARSGSKGVPHKNIRRLGGYPLITWSVSACKMVSLIGRTLVSTDSQEYADLAESAGAEVPFIRPETISGDTATDLEFVTHCLNFLSKTKSEPEYIVHIRPTTPFRDPLVIESAIKSFINNPVATALRSVHLMSESAYKSFEISSSGKLMCLGKKDANIDAANNARQLFPATYSANGYVDILSVRHIRKTNLLHGNNVMPYVTNKISELDTEEDFQRLELELAMHPEYISRLFR